MSKKSYLERKLAALPVDRRAKVDAMAAQVFAAALYPARHLHLHGFLGDAEAGGDFLLGHVLDATQDHDFTATRRQRVDRMGKEEQLLADTSGGRR